MYYPYYTIENTHGYTQQELNALNDELGRETKHIDRFQNPDLFKSISDRIMNDAEEILTFRGL